MHSFISKLVSPIRDFVFGKKQKAVTPIKTLGESGVKLSHFLSPEAIIINNAIKDKEEAIRMLSEHLCRLHNIESAETVSDEIIKRERLESTFLDNEVAIPHARYQGVKKITSVLGIFPQGIKENETEKLPAKFIFLFLSPVDALTQHLQLLTRIAFVFQDNLVKSSLLKIKDPADIYYLIKEKEGIA
ncbi:MAG: PTS sugar transporter subunit IIA [Candidatus Ancaeobacter aquaticus]|nr:PTS sugar transporter subunit IIA [Candidatus Ancaeobacter aquaticus]